MVMAEMEKPRDTFILARGDYRNQTEKVSPACRRCCRRLPKDAPLNRLTLAKWLVHPGHPLTSRVAVNRFWQMYFGIGLVKTQEDFGVQGEPPSHPELLDWLATEFVRTGWDVRAMQRLIVTSATYRQSSKVTPALLEKDPENRLLARGPRVRLPAEMIRDTALAASGLLNDRDRRAERAAVSAEGTLGGDGVRRRVLGAGVRAEPRARSLPPRHVHALEAHRAAGVAGDVRRARSREVHGAPGADQHAAAGAGAAERSDVRRGVARAGAARDARGRQGREEPRSCTRSAWPRRACRRARRSRCCGRCSRDGSRLSARIGRPR